MRNISRLEVGAIPAKPQEFQFYDEDGNIAPLGAYQDFEVELIGSDNERVDLTGIVVDALPGSGRVRVVWPRRKDVFAKTGEYVLRFKFSNENSVDYSDVHTIKVTNFGRIEA